MFSGFSDNTKTLPRCWDNTASSGYRSPSCGLKYPFWLKFRGWNQQPPIWIVGLYHPFMVYYWGWWILLLYSTLYLLFQSSINLPIVGFTVIHTWTIHGSTMQLYIEEPYMLIPIYSITMDDPIFHYPSIRGSSWGDTPILYSQPDFLTPWT